MCQAILRPEMRRIISGSFSSSIKGPVFVNLINGVPYISMTQSGPRKNRDAHGEHDDTSRPAVDEVVVSTNSHILHENFRRKVVWRPTCRLFGRDQKIHFAQTKARAKERTLSIVKLSTALARPKSVTLTIGGSSFVRSTFCGN